MRIFISFILLVSSLFSYDLSKLVHPTPTYESIQKLHTLQSRAFEQDALDSDEAMQDLLKENQIYLNNILQSIKSDPYSEGFLIEEDYYKRLLFLQSRLNLNKKRGNEFAIYRDEIALAYLLHIKRVNDYVLSLSSMLQGYPTTNEIVNFAGEVRTSLSEEEKRRFTKIYQSVLKDDNPLAQGIRDNFKAYITLLETYERLIDFTQKNPDLLTQETIFTLINYDDIINGVNASPSARWLNQQISFLYLNSGKLVSLSIIGVLLALSLYLSKWVLRFGFLNFKHYENRKLLKPIRLLLGVTALDYIVLTLMYPLLPSNIGEAFILFAYVFSLSYLAMELIAYVIIGYFETQESSQNEKALVSLFIDILKTFLVISAFVFYLNKMGVSLQTVLTSVGIFGIGIALAAKDSIANLFGSLNLLLDNTFSQGDFITIGTLEGEVVKVGLRSTRIRAFDNSLIIMPNAEAALKPVVNWSKRRLGREIKTNIAIPYSTQPQVIKAIIDEIRYMVAQHPDLVQNDDIKRYEDASKTELFLSKKHLLGLKKDRFVYLDRFDPSHLSIFVQTFSRSTEREAWYKVKEDLLYSIWEILIKHNVDFALPGQNILLETKEKKEQK